MSIGNSQSNFLAAAAGKHDGVAPQTSLPALSRRIAELESTVQTLQKRLSGYERVYSENPVPTLVYDCKSFQILEANESALALYGYKAEELCTLKILDLFPPQTRSQLSALKGELCKPINAIGPFPHRTASHQELFVGMVFLPFEIEGTDAQIGRA
ncbi:MAG: PAS domain S-box protein, partial [Acidobacteriaceae bacterium]|nr:PAS domain S-box protein [Acidobacteriaceae bacterium]